MVFVTIEAVIVFLARSEGRVVDCGDAEYERGVEETRDGEDVGGRYVRPKLVRLLGRGCIRQKRGVGVTSKIQD